VLSDNYEGGPSLNRNQPVIFVEKRAVRYGVTDVLTLVVGFGVLPLAWVVWTVDMFFLRFPGSLIRFTSLRWVPFGLLLLVIWFNDNPPSTLPGFRRLRGNIHTSPKRVGLMFPVLTLGLFLVLFSLTAGKAVLTRSELNAAESNTFFAGLLTLMTGLVIAFSWLGDKEDYSRTGYVLKGSGPGGGTTGTTGPRSFPRASPGPQPSDRQREDWRYGRALADLFGLSVVTAGFLLMIASAFLA